MSDTDWDVLVITYLLFGPFGLLVWCIVRGVGILVVSQPSKLVKRVRFSHTAPNLSPRSSEDRTTAF